MSEESELLYRLLGEHGWADHYQCGWENGKPPGEGMCSKEWMERESCGDLIAAMQHLGWLTA